MANRRRRFEIDEDEQKQRLPNYGQLRLRIHQSQFQTSSTRSFIDTNGVNHNHPPDQITMKQKVLHYTIQERFDGRLLMFSTPKLLSAVFDSDIILSDDTFNKCAF